MHSIIIIFLIKASSRNAIRKTIWEVSEAATTLLVYLSIRYFNSCRRLPETKRHSSLFLHWSGSKSGASPGGG